MVILNDRSKEYYLSLSSRAHGEFMLLQNWLHEIDMMEVGHGEWKCSSGKHKVHKYYNSLYDHI
jgi:hypothetical protein